MGHKIKFTTIIELIDDGETYHDVLQTSTINGITLSDILAQFPDHLRGAGFGLPEDVKEFFEVHQCRL